MMGRGMTKSMKFQEASTRRALIAAKLKHLSTWKSLTDARDTFKERRNKRLSKVKEEERKLLFFIDLCNTAAVIDFTCKKTEAGHFIPWQKKVISTPTARGSSYRIHAFAHFFSLEMGIIIRNLTYMGQEFHPQVPLQPEETLLKEKYTFSRGNKKSINKDQSIRCMLCGDIFR